MSAGGGRGPPGQGPSTWVGALASRSGPGGRCWNPPWDQGLGSVPDPISLSKLLRGEDESPGQGVPGKSWI